MENYHIPPTWDNLLQRAEDWEVDYDEHTGYATLKIWEDVDAHGYLLVTHTWMKSWTEERFRELESWMRREYGDVEEAEEGSSEEEDPTGACCGQDSGSGCIAEGDPSSR